MRGMRVGDIKSEGGEEVELESVIEDFILW